MSNDYDYSNTPLPSDDYRNRAAWIESRGDPGARTGNSQYRGLYQLGYDQIGDNWKDPAAQNQALNKVYARDYGQLSSALGRAPTDAEMYAAHNMGVRGYLTRLNNPDAMATDTPGLPSSHAASNPFGIPKDQLSQTTNAQYLQRVNGVWDSAGKYSGGFQQGVNPNPTQVAAAQPPPAPGAQPQPPQFDISSLLAKLKNASGVSNPGENAGYSDALASMGANIDSSGNITQAGGSGPSPSAVMNVAQGLMKAGMTPQQAPQGQQLTPQELQAMTQPMRPLPLNIPKLIG